MASERSASVGCGAVLACSANSLRKPSISAFWATDHGGADGRDFSLVITRRRGSLLAVFAALVLAGLSAHGNTEIGELHHIDRGYDHLVEKLQGLGANISRVDTK